MAKSKLPAKSKKKANAPRGKLWRELKPGTQRKYKAAGVTPQKYNAARTKRGQVRADYLGLPRFKISGPPTPAYHSYMARAIKNITEVFGDAPKFKPHRLRGWLEDITPSRIKKLAEASKGEIYRWAFNPDEEYSNEEASTPPKSEQRPHEIGGYLFYH